MNFDLNIDNYKKNELEEMFELPKKYNLQMIEIKELKLKENMHMDKTISEVIKLQTFIFLDEAKKILSSNLNTESKSNFIIEKQVTPYVNSLPSEFYPGKINPLQRRTIKQNLNIDTRFRDNYYSTNSSNFNFDLPIKFTNILTMQLTAFEFPTTYYNISASRGTNYFNISYNTSTQTIIIPDGNYNPQSLITFLNFYVSPAGPVGISVFNNISFVLDIDSGNSGSGKIIISINQNGSTSDVLTLNFQADINGNPDFNNPLPLKFGWLLGFRNGIYTKNINYVSDGIPDLSNSKYIYLVVDDHNNNVNNGFYSAFNSSVLNKNILARITLSPGSFNVVTQNNLSLISTERQYFGPVDIQKLSIQILDEFGRVISLNNMDYSFCLTFHSVYDL